MSQGVSDFITSLIVHFPVKHESPQREQEWLKSMVRSLKGFTPDVLARAAQSIANTRKDRRFPLLSECKDACIETAKFMKAESPQLLAIASLSNFSDDREKLAYELLLGPMGKRAARERWVHKLFTFIREKMRLPDDAEVVWIINEVKAFHRELDKCRAALPGSISSKLVPLGVSILVKRDALANYVETGVLP